MGAILVQRSSYANLTMLIEALLIVPAAVACTCKLATLLTAQQERITATRVVKPTLYVSPVAPVTVASAPGTVAPLRTS